ncbi:hypothetical protein E2C01_062051 [Portunus trituberculatus]|uniref:Uncharacterized protein n=1 Tax=Portunus trituberculatus TaxID=210409 RepID=A0A5B7HE23_PORTR|nr:hypothetical protein [Portunus trituberculatus]
MDLIPSQDPYSSLEQWSQCAYSPESRDEASATDIGLGRSADNKDSLVVQSIRRSEGRANQTPRGRTAASENVTHAVGGDGQPSV